MDDFGGSGNLADFSLGNALQLDHSPSVTTAASIIRRLADALEAGTNIPPPPASNCSKTPYPRALDDYTEHQRLVAWAQNALRVRGLRAKFFPASEIFGEPCWEMILDLFIARLTGRLISVTSACVAARVPATTALRWLTVLEKERLVERAADTRDGRRVYVSLTDRGFEATKGLILSVTG